MTDSRARHTRTHARTHSPETTPTSISLAWATLGEETRQSVSARLSARLPACTGHPANLAWPELSLGRWLAHAVYALGSVALPFARVRRLCVGIGSPFPSPRPPISPLGRHPPIQLVSSPPTQPATATLFSLALFLTTTLTPSTPAPLITMEGEYFLPAAAPLQAP